MKNKKVFSYLLAFLIPSILMLIIYACVGIYPFGKKSLLTVDLAGQYVAFFNAYKNILNGTISAFYSFSKTLGGNMFGLITYYLMSPFNLILLLFDRINITEAILIINILKTGACGLTGYIYFHKTFKDKGLVPIVFSTVYALCAYNIVYSQNLLWLDGVIFLPLVFLGIDYLIEKQKPLLFYLMLTLTIFCNYYIGYMTCIGSLAYFLYKLYLANDYKLSWKNNKKDILYFFKYALLAVGTTMIILLPSLFSLMVGKADTSLSEFIPKQTYPVIELISRFFIGSFSNSDLSGGCPNIYISLMMVILAFIYFFNSKIPHQEKKGTVILILFFAISFIFYPVDIIWHTFQHPAGFPFRYSFIFDFILLIIAYRCYQNITGVNRQTIKKMIPAVIILAIVMDKLMYNGSNMYYEIIGSGALIVSYLLYLYYSKNQTIKKLLAVIIALEISINGVLVVYNMKYQNRNEYTDFVNTYGQIIDNIKQQDNSFYRIEKEYSYSTNDPLLLNYNGISHFSSTYEGTNNSLLGDYLGIFNRFYITNYNGSTLVTDSIFNIKYILLNHEVSYYKLLEKNDEIYVYENPYSLPLGFMVNKNLSSLQLEELEPFINQNTIINNMTGLNKDIFLKNNNVSSKMNNLKLQESNKDTYIYNKNNSNLEASLNYKVKVDHTGELYAYISSDYNKKIDILLNGESIIDTSDQNDYRYNILDLGYYQSGDYLDFEVILLENQIKFDDVQFYTLDLNSFKEQIDILQNNDSLVLDEYTSDYIKAHISVINDDQILYTSIPLDKGWTIKVDGKKQEPVEIFDTLIGLELSKGNHTIEFSYQPRGLYAGGIITFISIALVIILKKRK